MLRSTLLTSVVALALSGCGGGNYIAPIGMTQAQVDQVNYKCDSQAAALIGADTSNFLIALEMKKRCLHAAGFTKEGTVSAAPAPGPGYALNMFAYRPNGELAGTRTMRCYSAAQQQECADVAPQIERELGPMLKAKGVNGTAVVRCEATSACQSNY